MRRNTRLHVAIIMDGNGRWARRHGQERIDGHRAGADSVRRVIEASPASGITTLTLYAFSSDNWKRPPGEVRALMELLERYLDEESDRCVENGVRVNLIGRRDRLPKSVTAAAERAEVKTARGRKLRVRIAVDYSARQAIAAAARRAAALGGRLDEKRFGELLNEVIGSQPAAPDVDLLIRTSGEKRLSDFLLWECAYAEFYFTELHWPEFGGEELERAVADFRGRERRFGGLLSGFGKSRSAG